MQTNPDTILRRVYSLPLPSLDPPRAVGIDEWAIRKGRAYGTLVVDLERRRPIDLVPDCSGMTEADWQRRRSGIQIVARDRSTEYARAATADAPAALKVADRWHLLLNMRQTLQCWLGRVHGRLRQLPALSSSDGRRPGERLRAYRRSAAEITMSPDNCAQRLAAYEDVRRHHLAGETLLAMGHATGLARATVRRYAQAEGFPERAIQRPAPSRLHPYLAHLEPRMAEGCENAMTLWREIRDEGFAGTHRQVHRYVAERRTVRARRTAHSWPLRTGSTGAEVLRAESIASPKQMAWILVQPITTLPPRAAADLARIRQDAEAVRVADLVRGSRCRCAPVAWMATDRRMRSANSTDGFWRSAPAASRHWRPSRLAWHRTGRRFGRTDDVLNQRAGRRADQPAEDAQTQHVRPRQLRPASPRTPRCLIHAKCGRTAKPREDHTRSVIHTVQPKVRRCESENLSQGVTKLARHVRKPTGGRATAIRLQVHMRKQDVAVERLEEMPPLDTRRRSYLRLAQPSDGPLIYRLRSDPKLSRFLNAPPTTVPQQVAWLTRYKEAEAANQQYYFILVSDGKDRGTVRMYDFRDINNLRSFCWGSWIIEPPPIVGLATYSALSIYELGFDHLGFEHAHFDVRKENESVVTFHLRAGAEIVREDGQDFYFHFTRQAYDRFKTSHTGAYDRHSVMKKNSKQDPT